MHAREDFHKAQLHRFSVVLAVWMTTFAAGACSLSDDASASIADRASVAVAARPSSALPPAGHAWVIFDADTVVAEVASTSDERAEGLMYRETVPDGTGMLFVFPDSQVRSFWMANTYVALDIAYLNPSFRVVDIVAMEPLITESYASAAPAMYGLEVRQGWYAEQDVGVGAQAEIVFGVLGR
jgi:uncharacterized membrane protein (UPF0127 family)